MNSRTLLIVIFSIIGAFVLLIGGIFGLYVYDRTIFGMPPRPQDTSSTASSNKANYIEPKIELTKTEFEEMQRELIRKALIKKQNDSLTSLKNSLIDSIRKYQNRIYSAKDSVKSMTDELAHTKNTLSKVNDSLGKIEKQYLSSKDYVSRLKDQLKNSESMIESKYDSLQIKNLKEFAKIYNNTNPTEVAKILEQIDESDAALILKFMQTKKAGKVIDAMQPEQAAAILLLGVK